MLSTVEKWEQLLNPAELRGRLIFASLFITAFELLKDSIVGNIRFFYTDDLDVDGNTVDDEYERTVLSRNKSPLLASLDWLSENEVIDEIDRQAFERIRTTRNSLAHELPTMVMGGKDFHHIERFQELVALIKKIEVWWVANFQVTLHPDFAEKEIDEKGVVPYPVLILQIMLEILSGNEDLLKHYRANGRFAAVL